MTLYYGDVDGHGGHTLDPRSLKMISTSRIGPNCYSLKRDKQQWIALINARVRLISS